MVRTAVRRQGLWNRAGGAALVSAVLGVLCGLGVFWTLTVAEAGQISRLSDSQSPPRDGRPRDERQRLPQSPGTASIRGHVVDAETGQPIARAHVTLDAREAGRAPVVASSGVDGAFELRGLPAGEFAVAAEKVTYERGAFPDQKRTMRPKRLPLVNGQTLEGIVIPLYHRGALAGRLTDAYGDPVEDCAVTAFRVQPGGRLRQVQGRSTDDIGAFRMAHVPAGTYLLFAQPQRSARADAVQDENETARGGTFYPGVTEIQQAQPVTIGRGQSATTLDWAIAEVTPSVVSGRVIDANGQPARGGSVQANVVLPGVAEGRGLFVSSASVESDGRFAMKLQPGQYRLDLLFAGNRYRPPSGFGSIFSIGDATPTPSRYGRLDITVGGEPLTDLTLVLSSETMMSGRVVFEGAAPRPAMPRGVSVGFRAPGTSGEDCRSFDTSEGVKPDWTFRASQLLGICMIEAGAPRPWSFKAVRHRGVDITDRAFDFAKATDLTDVEVILTDRETALTLDVHDESGRPTMEYAALAFPVDKNKWSHIRSVQTFAPPSIPPPPPPAANGSSGVDSGEDVLMGGSGSTSGIRTTYRINRDGSGEASLFGLPSGDYFIVALNDFAPEDVREPAFLEAVSLLATRVTLTGTEPQTVSLTRTTAPDHDR